MIFGEDLKNFICTGYRSLELLNVVQMEVGASIVISFEANKMELVKFNCYGIMQSPPLIGRKKERSFVSFSDN